jgi:hypothetical protein
VGKAPLVEVIRKWREKDASAATTALESLVISDAVRAAIEKANAP